MKRKYKIDLVEGHRIDIFLEDHFRVVTKIKQLSSQIVLLEIDHREEMAKVLSGLNGKTMLRAIYYDGVDVYLFNTTILKENQDRTVLQLSKPLEFYKVQRRQHVRSGWFMPMEYVELDGVETCRQLPNGQWLMNNQSLSYHPKGIILNLSGGGFEVKVNQHIKSNFIACRFKYRKKVYSHLGVVRRRSEVEEFGKITYRTGIEFIQMSEIDREKMINLVFEKIRTMQGKYYL